MLVKKIKGLIPRLALSALFVGLLTGILELYIGHRYILDPLLYGADPNFTYETYFAPTFYGMSKSIVVAITYFLVFWLAEKKKINLLAKSAIVGVVGTILFGIYYYFTFPIASVTSGVIVGLVHFTFIGGITYIFSKIVNIRKRNKKR